MNVDTILIVAALILAIVSVPNDGRYPLLPAAVICLAVALLT